MTTDYTERITSIEEQIAQLKNRQRELIQKSKAQERKARTKRLIERGAIVESVIGGTDELTNEQFKAFIEKIASADQTRQALEETRRQGGARPAQKPPIPKPSAEQTDDTNGEAENKGAD